MYMLLYLDLVETYFLFRRAVQTNDLDLFIYALFRMRDIFMATGHNKNYKAHDSLCAQVIEHKYHSSWCSVLTSE